jgi:hypothetical protein
MDSPITDWVATSISAVTNPLFVAIPTLGIIAIHTAPDPLQGLFWWGVTVVGISLAPLLFIARGVRAGRYSDHHVSVRACILSRLGTLVGSCSYIVSGVSRHCVGSVCGCSYFLVLWSSLGNILSF